MLVPQKEKTGENKQIEEGKFFAAISYIAFLCVVTLLLKRENKFALYHAKQGLIIFVAEAALLMVAMFPVVGQIAYIIGSSLALVASVYGILHAIQGKEVKIPLVTNFAEKISL